jgi:hypothetical protein
MDISVEAWRRFFPSYLRWHESFGGQRPKCRVMMQAKFGNTVQAINQAARQKIIFTRKGE